MFTRVYVSLLLAAALLAACDSSAPGTKTAVENHPATAAEGKDAGNLTSSAPPSAPVVQPDAGDPNENVSICQTLGIAAHPREPDMLIVLDRSLSMASGLLGSGRWKPSVAAVKAVTKQLDQSIRFGLMLFPTKAEDVCAPGSVLVNLELGTSAKIASVLDENSPYGNTPTSASLKTAGAALQYDRGMPDVVARDKYILLVTDGAPTCDRGTGSTDELATYAEISALAADDIKTYVIGYQTKGTNLEKALDEMARRGGTGDTAHRPVEDETTLVNQLKHISETAISCSYALEKAPDDPQYVRVQIDGTSYPLGANGWELANEKIINLGPSACAVLRDGKEHFLNINVECEPVIVQ